MMSITISFVVILTFFGHETMQYMARSRPMDAISFKEGKHSRLNNQNVFISVRIEITMGIV